MFDHSRGKMVASPDAALLVGHHATAHEVALQGTPVIVDHLKMEIIAFLRHGFPWDSRGKEKTSTVGFSIKRDKT